MHLFLHSRYSSASLGRPASSQLACLYSVLHLFCQEVKGAQKQKRPDERRGALFYGYNYAISLPACQEGKEIFFRC